MTMQSGFQRMVPACAAKLLQSMLGKTGESAGGFAGGASTKGILKGRMTVEGVEDYSTTVNPRGAHLDRVRGRHRGTDSACCHGAPAAQWCFAVSVQLASGAYGLLLRYRLSMRRPQAEPITWWP